MRASSIGLLVIASIASVVSPAHAAAEPTWPTITTSNVNFGPGEVRSNQAYVTARPDWTVFNSHGDTHVVVDVFGTVTPNDPVTIAPPWA